MKTDLVHKRADIIEDSAFEEFIVVCDEGTIEADASTLKEAEGSAEKQCEDELTASVAIYQLVGLYVKEGVKKVL